MVTFMSIICTKFSCGHFNEHYVVCSQIHCPFLILWVQHTLHLFHPFQNCDVINNQNDTLRYFTHSVQLVQPIQPRPDKDFPHSIQHKNLFY